MAENPTTSSLPAGFAEELVQFWNRLPNKAFFFGLLAAWFLLFQFFGSPVFAYVDSPSLFGWLIWKCYLKEGEDNDDALGIVVPLVVLAFLWWKRGELLGVSHRTWAPALVFLAGCLFLHLAGYLTEQPRISAVALFGGIYALVGLAWGFRW